MADESTASGATQPAGTTPRDSVAADPSATVVLLRPAESAPEVLLVQRNAELRFHGGAWAFPGGRVETDDRGQDGELGAARRAAARELEEEAGLVLDPAVLVPISHWTTPEGRSRRFATWFFAAAAGPGEVRIDGGEILAHRWLAAAAALDARARGEIVLPPPTFVTLSLLVGAVSVEAVLAQFAGRAPETILPKPVPVADGICSLYPGDAGYETLDPERPGTRNRLWIREAGWRYERELREDG
jgi:8-oxo-dGTP pyrophosphatase MutT (NUDIX family)